MTRKDIDPKLKKLCCKIVELVVSGVVFAVIASLLTTSIIERAEEKKVISSQLRNISNIYIGCNKLWMDDKFGNPQFSAQKENYLLCAYISDFFVVQVAFNESSSAQAYLITALDNKKKIGIEIDDQTIQFPLNTRLGDFSYYDFVGSPESVFSFVSQGNARALYSEQYYFMSAGNYYNYYIASFDFGKLTGSVQDFISQFSILSSDVDNEVTLESVKGFQVITDRRNNYPNTYGVSSEVDITDLFFTYDWFNSQQLRNKLNK